MAQTSPGVLEDGSGSDCSGIKSGEEEYYSDVDTDSARKIKNLKHENEGVEKESEVFFACGAKVL